LYELKTHYRHREDIGAKRLTLREWKPWFARGCGSQHFITRGDKGLTPSKKRESCQGKLRHGKKKRWTSAIIVPPNEQRQFKRVGKTKVLGKDKMPAERPRALNSSLTRNDGRSMDAIVSSQYGLKGKRVGGQLGKKRIRSANDTVKRKAADGVKKKATFQAINLKTEGIGRKKETQ